MQRLSSSYVIAVCRRAWSCRLPNSSTRAVLAFALFAAVQLADAVLTQRGIERFGLAAEANPLIGFTMRSFGITTALASWKLFAVLAGAVLHVSERHLALAILTLFAVFAAAVPWAWILAV